MRPRVAILTTFYEATSGYSLVAVAETQIRMLLDNGYNPRVIVQENFAELAPPSVWCKEMVDLRPVLPDLPNATPDNVRAMMDEHFADIDVIIAHDICLQGYYKAHNKAVEDYAKDHNKLWLHCIHSCPSGTGYTLPSGYIVYPNDSDRAQVVRSYRLAGQEHRVVPNRASHSIDPLLVWPYDKLTRSLARDADLFGGDIVAVYPARLDRGKQPEKIIRLMHGVKQAGYDPRLLIIDWQSMGDRFQRYIDELEDLAELLGLRRRVNFTSRLNDTCNNGIPRNSVMELMDIANVYIHPSTVETYSLVVHEAILRGKLVVLNADFPPMRELFGSSALYMNFSSDRFRTTYSPDEQSYWDDEARRMLSEFKRCRNLVLQLEARQKWTPQAQWREFEPLLFLEPA